MVDPAGVVDRRVVVLERNDPGFIDRAVVFQQVNGVGNHDGIPCGRSQSSCLACFAKNRIDLPQIAQADGATSRRSALMTYWAPRLVAPTGEKQ